MKLSKWIKAALVSGAIASNSAFAGIPVFDGVNVAQSILQVINWGQQLQDMATQIQTQADQLQTQGQQLQSMTGQRGLGSILNDPAIRSYLPANADAVYQAITTSGYGGLTAEARSIRDSTSLYNCEGVPADFQTLCSASLNKSAQDLAYSKTAYQTASQRSNQIQSLMNQINSTGDQKAIDELNARITAEGVAVANEANRLALAAQMQQATDRINDQREREWYLSAIQRSSPLGNQHYTD